MIGLFEVIDTSWQALVKKTYKAFGAIGFNKKKFPMLKMKGPIWMPWQLFWIQLSIVKCWVWLKVSEPHVLDVPSLKLGNFNFWWKSVQRP